MGKYILALAISTLLAPASFAGALTFDFTYAQINGSAAAVGQLTIDSGALTAVLSSASDAPYPISDLQALTITVSGASAGNGTFGLSDFQTFYWWSAGANFNFAQNLVGQPTSGGPWGTITAGTGDFNFLNAATSPSAPSGIFYFSLEADGATANTMQLTSVQEVAAPEPGAIGLVGLGGLAIIAFSRQWRLR